MKQKPDVLEHGWTRKSGQIAVDTLTAAQANEQVEYDKAVRCALKAMGYWPCHSRVNKKVKRRKTVRQRRRLHSKIPGWSTNVDPAQLAFHLFPLLASLIPMGQ
jgi:hypothetical protein